MTTQKQIEANKQNALVSTGATSEEGKAIVCKNAIKHGIFAKDLIITRGDGKENPEEFKAIFENLIDDFNPEGQMQYLLVEKIAIDFWRLRRLIRFETGSIRDQIDMVIDRYYNETNYTGNKVNSTNEELTKEIEKNQDWIDWNKSYIKCLKQGLVSFDTPTWKNKDIESDIEEDLNMVLDKVKYDISAKGHDIKPYIDEEATFEDMKKLLDKSGYTKEDISNILIECLEKQNKDYQEKITEIEKQKLKNNFREEVLVKLNIVPSFNNLDKVMKYEKSLQKSIFQNMMILKRLQDNT